VTRSWMPDSGWTGDWRMPDVLSRPVSEPERGMLVSMSCGGMGPARLASALKDARTVSEVGSSVGENWRGALRHLGSLGGRAVVPSDEEYPDLLVRVAAPPPLLFVRGAALDLLQPAVAIVGSRACTSGAKRFAARLGEAIAAAGFTIVSGLARGIDAAAHDGALTTGRTIGVLGTGLDVVYPAEHRELANCVTSRGALVTEFPPGIGPRAWHFPARNRIISGLCIALIVVEAGIGSGALITAGFAVDEGREVFACITGPENPAGAGLRAMLKDGARIIVDAEQAVEDLVGHAQTQGYEITSTTRLATADAEPELTGVHRVVYEAVADDSTAEDVAGITSLAPARVAAILTELELDGLIESHTGRWRRC
jgi:DNA processing protein